MKLKSILATGILALTLGNMAQATTFLHLTGSTAFRSAAVVAMENLFTHSGVATGTFQYLDGTNITINKFRMAIVGTAAANAEQTATYVVMEGNLGIAGVADPVVLKLSWTGSVGGLLTTKNAYNINTIVNGWLDASQLAGTAELAAAGAATMTGIAAGTEVYTRTDGDPDAAGTPDAAFSDNVQGTVGISGLFGRGTKAGKVGVIPFDWCVSNGVTGTIKLAGVASGGGNTLTFTSATVVATGAAATAAQVAALTVYSGSGFTNAQRNPAITAAVLNGDNTTGTITVATLPAPIAATYIAGVKGTPCPITDLTAIQAKALLTQGNKLSNFTGNPADDSVAVYGTGRNYDSGTRVSYVTETGVGVTGAMAQVCPTFFGGAAYPIAFPNAGTIGGATNASGDPSKWVANMDLWAAETLYGATASPLSFVQGGSGFNGGGGVAGALATPGWLTAAPSGAGSAPYYDPSTTNSGKNAASGAWVVGYLGRSDSRAACKTTVGPNTGHRLTYNGKADWVGASGYGGTLDTDMNADGTANGVGNAGTGFDNSQIVEGEYQNWEVEYLYTKLNANPAKGVFDTVANEMLANTYSEISLSFGLVLSTMNYSKAGEGKPAEFGGY